MKFKQVYCTSCDQPMQYNPGLSIFYQGKNVGALCDNCIGNRTQLKLLLVKDKEYFELKQMLVDITTKEELNA